jgi:hypothetical protein
MSVDTFCGKSETWITLNLLGLKSIPTCFLFSYKENNDFLDSTTKLPKKRKVFKNFVKFREKLLFSRKVFLHLQAFS